MKLRINKFLDFILSFNIPTGNKNINPVIVINPIKNPICQPFRFIFFKKIGKKKNDMCNIIDLEKVREFINLDFSIIRINNLFINKFI